MVGIFLRFLLSFSTVGNIWVDCEQSLFFLRFSEGNARASPRRAAREERESRAAARKDKSFLPLTSRAFCHARVHLRVSRVSLLVLQ